MVIAYLMNNYPMSYDEAFSYVQLRRPILRPNSNFIQQLHAHR